MDLTSYEPSLVLPSGGDTGYVGLVLAEDGVLWLLLQLSRR